MELSPRETVAGWGGIWGQLRYGSDGRGPRKKHFSPDMTGHLNQGAFGVPWWFFYLEVTVARLLFHACLCGSVMGSWQESEGVCVHSVQRASRRTNVAAEHCRCGQSELRGSAGVEHMLGFKTDPEKAVCNCFRAMIA